MSIARIDQLEQNLRAWSLRTPALSLASSLGAEDMVITDLICRKNLPVRIFTLDTGRLPEATYRLLDRIFEHYGRRIEVFWPAPEDVEELVKEQGVNGFYHGLAARRACCAARKVKPLARALSGQTGWITGLRRDQSPTRGDLVTEIWDEGHGLMKYSPLLDWSREEVWAVLEEYRVPYNALHDQHYASIGCAPCTRAIQPGEDERAGRWWWESSDSKECGLHVASEAEKATQAS